MYAVDKEKIALRQGLKIFKCDISDKKSLENILEKIKPSYIINLIGLIGEYDFEILYRINVDVSRHILDWSISKGKQIVKRILLIGSSAEYGIPNKIQFLRKQIWHQ